MAILKNDNEKFKAALRKYLNTHFIYSVAEFLFVKIIYNTVVKKCIFYTVKIVYICVLMTCSTSYCPSDTLKDPWNVCTYVCLKISTQSIDIFKTYLLTLIYVMHIKQNRRLAVLFAI